LEQRVVQRTAQLEAANKELETFTYSVSHELRAPLRHIGGFSKILVEEFGPALDPTAQHYLQRIEEGTRRMGVLVDELLNLARVGRHSLSLQVTGLNSIVAELVSMLKPESEGRQVEWIIADLPFVECDPVLIKQVLQNLMANALKFTRPRPRAVIEIGQVEENGNPAVFVRDNGVGCFRFSLLPRSFRETFFRSSSQTCAARLEVAQGGWNRSPQADQKRSADQDYPRGHHDLLEGRAGSRKWLQLGRKQLHPEARGFRPVSKHSQAGRAV